MVAGTFLLCFIRGGAKKIGFYSRVTISKFEKARAARRKPRGGVDDGAFNASPSAIKTQQITLLLHAALYSRNIFGHVAFINEGSLFVVILKRKD